ncbi:hypothetical protein FB451DRAFT_106844 [Mycena latifolia]|nr:hypothetical protein FB451DRAFT_106844 [Mycena latifolia]
MATCDDHDEKTSLRTRLRAVTPLSRGRYNKPYSAGVEYADWTITHGFGLGNSAPRSGADDRLGHWKTHVHPEGQPYFHRDGDGVSLSVVTESWIQDPQTMARLGQAIEQVEADLAKQGTREAALELYIQVEEEGCAYYLVGHGAHIVFWLDDQNATDLYLACTSAAHLKLRLEECYWTHIEYFPMHFGPRGLGQEPWDSLICVLAHARLDQMTSCDSTSGWSAEECADLLQVLESSREHTANGHIICLVARLWMMVYHQRALDFYGDRNCRIMRTQAILYDPEPKYRFISVLASWVSFNISRDYLLRLDRVFIDHIVYKFEFQAMMKGFVANWTNNLRGTTIGLLLHIFFVVLEADMRIAAASAGLLGTSFVVAKAFIFCYTPMQTISAAEALEYLESVHSPTLGFSLLALIFALPQALQFWGLLAVLANCGIIFTRYFGCVASIVVAAVLGLFVLLFLWTTSAGFNAHLARISAYFTRSKLLLFLRTNSASFNTRLARIFTRSERALRLRDGVQEILDRLETSQKLEALV